jgi:hypothetical protein
VLQVAVVEEGERLAGLDRGEQDEAAIKAGATAIFLLRHCAVVFGFVDHVGLHADREITRGRSALHRPPLVVFTRIAGRDADVDTRSAHGLTRGQRKIGFLQRFERRLHGEHALDLGIADDECH